MLTIFAIIFTVGLILGELFHRLKLPELLGMLVAGVILGPYCLGILSEEFVTGAADLRTAALVIILIRAGLGIKKDSLKGIGLPALQLSFIPCLVEGAFVMMAAHYLLQIPVLEAGVLAFIISAVSPAVVVPQMLHLIEKKIGSNKNIPTLILASASIDDVFAITLFGIFLELAIGHPQSVMMDILQIPLRIGLGIMAGCLWGYVLLLSFKRYAHVRETKKVMIFMIMAIFLHGMEQFVPIASLIGIMVIGFIILSRDETLARSLAVKFNKLWIFAEIILFVLIGAQVNLSVAFNSGLIGLVIIILGLCGRSIGVWVSLLFSRLNYKEKMFCTFSYIPKATVQAALGAIPLSMGIASGEIILAIAVLSIVVTAPVGAILIKTSAGYLLESPDTQPAPID